MMDLGMYLLDRNMDWWEVPGRARLAGQSNYQILEA